jgi:hypothetical protein
VVVPFHGAATLHPKIVIWVLEMIDEAGRAAGATEKS